MTLPKKKARLSSEMPVSWNPNQSELNPFLSTILSNLSALPLQQQFLLTQMILSGAACPPFNPLANALEIWSNNALLLQSQNLHSAKNEVQKRMYSSNSSVTTKSNPNSHTVSKHSNSQSDSNEKSTFDDDDNSPTIASALATMPNNSNEQSTATFDGVNLEEIRQFAKAFKLRRLALGLTQTQVGQALSVTRGPAYSQSAICRFEKLDITPKSASKIKPVLEKWMQEAEVKYSDRLKSGKSNLHELLTDFNTKKRKRRTSFTPEALDKLNNAFDLNSHPSSVDMSNLAHELNYDREVIRVWFCNKRQALKNSAKKFKTSSAQEENDSSNSSLMENKLLDSEDPSVAEQIDQTV